MVTVDEETQAKEFLKRAEVRTMRKDLRALRESDALKERDKIAKIKTLEEQLEEKKKVLAAEATARAEKTGLQEVLQKEEKEEVIAEKDLKNYATEAERQQIFLLESQRLGFEKQVDAIDKEKDPALKLEKNKLLLLKQEQQKRLNTILEEEKKLENEQKFITEKQQTTTIASQRKGLEQSRWDLDKKIQDIEKKRWEAEKETEDTDSKVSQIDKSSQQLVTDKNGLQNKILGIDRSLREIYSVVIAREEENRKGLAKEEVARKKVLSEARAAESEKVQREQWTGKRNIENKPFLANAPIPLKKKMAKSFEAEEEQRKKFLQDIENLSQQENKEQSQTQQQTPTSPIPPPHKS